MNVVTKYTRLAICVLALTVFACKPKTSEKIETSSGEAVAQKMWDALGFNNLNKVSLIGWKVDGKYYIWDHKNNTGTVIMDSISATFSLHSGAGVAFKLDERILGDDQTFAISDAWKAWQNNYVWVLGAYDVVAKGMNKTLMTDSTAAYTLHVKYPDNSPRSGNTNTWLLDSTYLPSAAYVLTPLMPNGAMHFTWENYTTLPSGIKIAQSHKFSAYDKMITEIKEGNTLQDFGVTQPLFDAYNATYNRKSK